MTGFAYVKENTAADNHRYLANKQNLGFYTWTIGINDGVDLEMISASPNFAFQIVDPTGKQTSTGKPIGFIGSTLTSRGFIIQPNVTASSSPSALVPALSTFIGINDGVDLETISASHGDLTGKYTSTGKSARLY